MPEDLLYHRRYPRAEPRTGGVPTTNMEELLRVLNLTQELSLDVVRDLQPRIQIPMQLQMEPWERQLEHELELFGRHLERLLLQERLALQKPLAPLNSDIKTPEVICTSKASYFECLFQKSRSLLYGDKYKESLPSQDIQGTEWRVRKEFFANLGSLEELKDFILKMKRVLHFIIADTSTQSTRTSFEFLNSFISEEYRSSILNAMNSRDWEKVESLVMPLAAVLPGRAILYHAFLILAAFHLSVVYQYLIGHIDRAGGKTYSSGSLEYRNIYISIVLFLGAYIWIKSRDDVAPPSQQKPSKGIHRKSRVTELGLKEYYGSFEPRFKPPRAENYISVGSYEEEEDAKKMYQILAFYYDKNVPGELPLPYGGTFIIPRMTEEEQRLNPEDKRKWVKGNAKTVYDGYNLVYADLILGCIEYPVGNQIQPPLDCPNASAEFGWMDSSGVQAAEAHPTFQLGNDRVPASPSNLSPNVGPCIEYPVSDQIQPTEDTVDCPNASAEFGWMDSSGVQAAEAHPTFQLDNLGNDRVPASPSNLSPVIAGMQDHVANYPLSGHIVGRDASQYVIQPGLPGEQYLEPQLQQGSLPETQANNLEIDVILDNRSLNRKVEELQGQLDHQQLKSQQQENRLLQLERALEILQSTNQQLKRQQDHDRLDIQQLRSRISELDPEVGNLRSPEYARKRTCFRLQDHMIHNTN